MFSRSAASLHQRPTAAALVLLLAFVAFACNGCVSTLGRVPLNAADKRFEYGAPGGPKFSQGTEQTLRAYDIPQRLSQSQLDSILKEMESNPTPELVYAYVETSYLRARSIENRDPKQAKKLYLSSALYAYHYFGNPVLNSRNSSIFNAQSLDVCALYNGACERFLHLELQDADKNDFPFRDGVTTNIALDGEKYSIYTKIATCSWHKQELHSFKIVADCPVEPLSYDCRRQGVGVALVAERHPVEGVERAEEKYYPADLYFPMTALLRPNPALPLGALPPIDPNARADNEDENNAQAALELYDPLVSTLLSAPLPIELESNLTAPLSFFLNESTQINDKTILSGVLSPDTMREMTQTDVPTRERTLQGLYLLEPYDPEKIPVVMTHGLFSSPSTWLDMYNALRNASEIQNAYQFWFYFYPTGQPFWASAAELRGDLSRFRETVDPGHSSPALDRVVLIGHSMGGLISRMQVQESGDRIWNAISSADFDDADIDSEIKEDIRSWFFFEPNPSVKRVITIATPFEGSEFANNFTSWIAESAVALPQTVAKTLLSTAKSGDIDDPALLETKTSVDSLSPKCPIFKLLDRCSIPDDVALNNIVGEIPSLANRKFFPHSTDGVVDFCSSHREDVESERVVPEKHTVVHRHPAAIMEVKELLVKHLELARREFPETFANEALANSDAVRSPTPIQALASYAPTFPENTERNDDITQEVPATTIYASSAAMDGQRR